MAKRLLKNKLIRREDISKTLEKIKSSRADYVTEDGEVYSDYGNGMFLKKKCFQNKHNGYIYVNFVSKNGNIVSRRVHRLVAEAFIKKDSDKCNVVMHIDNDKTNNKVGNLKWGTTSENTKQAFDDKLAVNDKGFDDSQSFPVAVFNLDKSLKCIYGSVSIASEKESVSKTGILYQAKHLVKKTSAIPRCGKYFRYLDEYNEKGFIL